MSVPLRDRDLGVSHDDEVSRIAASCRRLRGAYGDRSASSIQACPYDTKAEATPPHGGDCADCTSSGKETKSHALVRSSEAEEEAKALYQTVVSGGEIAPGIGIAQLRAEKGNMFGVLLCVDRSGKTVVLKAFSGALAKSDKMEIPGWCPPIPTRNQGETNRKAGELRQLAVNKASTTEQFKAADGQRKRWDEEKKTLQRESTQLTRQLQQLQDNVTPKSDAKDMLKENQRQERARSSLADKGPAIDKRLRELEGELDGHPDPNPYTAEANRLQRELQVLAQQVKEAEAELTADVIENRVLRNAAGQEKSFPECCRPKEKANDPRTGNCAAPKLLAEAQRQGLTPVSLAEFWVGKDQGEQKEFAPDGGGGGFVPSCECCRSFMGFALHGLGEQQKSAEAVQRDTLNAAHAQEAKALNTRHEQERKPLEARHKEEAAKVEEEVKVLDGSERATRLVALWSRHAQEWTTVVSQQAKESVALWSRQAEEFVKLIS